MKFIYLLPLLLFSCTTSVEDESDFQETQSPLGACLEENFQDYFDNFDLIIEVLNSDGLLVDDKDGFAGTIQFLYSHEIVQYDLTEDERSQLEFIDEITDLSVLLSCCQWYKKDHSLTENQIEFFEEFHDSVIAGAVDHQKISGIINAMSEQEFESKYVRETALIFIGNELIRNHYLHY